jgi:hypothetical protein
MSRDVSDRGRWLVPLPGECVVTESRGALSVYVPVKASTGAAVDFELPLKIYIIETVERETRSKHLRQFGIVAALVVGMFLCQWPASYSSANAVPSLPISAAAAGARVPAAAAPHRLAFAAGMQNSF